MAPELCGRRQYDERVDVWSLGVITYIMMTGEPPFIGENENVTKKNDSDYQASLRTPAVVEQSQVQRFR